MNFVDFVDTVEEFKNTTFEILYIYEKPIITVTYNILGSLTLIILFHENLYKIYKNKPFAQKLPACPRQSGKNPSDRSACPWSAGGNPSLN